MNAHDDYAALLALTGGLAKEHAVLALDEIDYLRERVAGLMAQLEYTAAEYREQLGAVRYLTEQIGEMQDRLAAADRMEAALAAVLPSLEQQMTPARPRLVEP